MDDHDFSIRNELDSLGQFDYDLHGLLAQYNHAPSPSSPPPRQFAGSDPYLANLVGQLQGIVGSNSNSPTSNNLGGLNFNIEAETLRWVVVLVFLVVVLWLVFRYQSRPRRNPLKRRLRQLEEQVKTLSKKKNLALPDEETDPDEDE